MDVRKYGNSPLCPTGHQPFGAAAQKGKNWEKQLKEEDDDDNEDKAAYKDRQTRLET